MVRMSSLDILSPKSLMWSGESLLSLLEDEGPGSGADGGGDSGPLLIALRHVLLGEHAGPEITWRLGASLLLRPKLGTLTRDSLEEIIRSQFE